MDGTIALHVNWTLPQRTKTESDDIEIADFELLCTTLSALLWRKHNGKVKLYTDRAGFKYYQNAGMLDLWNGGIDIETLESIPPSINPTIYWAAAKIFAIQNEKGPVVMMDTDMLVWKNLPEIKDHPLAAFHTEPINGCYIPYEKLLKRKDYELDPEWAWEELPVNTALCYIGDEKFKKYYTSSAIDFMTDNDATPPELISQMVFAEQRIFSMCAKKMGIPIHTFLPKLYDGNNTDFTHIWGAKDVAKKDPNFREELCEALTRAILRESGNSRER